MAVQDGYGKSSGSESLVFAYDLKDTINSYRGQPATNIWLSGNPNGQGSGVQIIQTNYFLGKVIDSGVVYRNYVTNPAQSDTGTYYNNGGLNIGSMSFSNLNPSTRYIQISFDYYGVTPYRRFCCSGTGLNGYLGVTSTDSTTDTYGWDTTYSPGSGDDWNNDASRMGYWQKISLIVALRGDKNPSNIWALYIYMDAATQGEGYFANMIFTEHPTYPTGPIRWTSGTRSNTQGLLDLTGNSSIDLSTVSFNSDSQMTFDGTDDYVTFTHSSGQEPLNNVTFETIVKLTSTSNYKGMFMKSNYGNPNGHIAVHTVGNGYMRLECSDTLGSVRYLDTGSLGTNTRFTPNETVHFTLTYDGTNIRTYINSVLKDTYTWTYGLGNNQGNLELGRFWAGSWSGDIYQFKQFNRVLTSTEITNNYLKYKRQYGLT